MKYLILALLLVGCAPSKPMKLEKGEKAKIYIPAYNKMCAEEKDNEVCKK